MKKSTKAALFSALIFPGLGLLWLKHYARAAIFMVPSLIAFWYLCSTLYQAIAPLYASLLRDAEEGVLILDPANMSALIEQVQQSIASHQNQLFVAKAVIVAAWICSIISSYFLGTKHDLAKPQDSFKS